MALNTAPGDGPSVLDAPAVADPAVVPAVAVVVDNPWARVKAPTNRASGSHSIGSYSAGCLSGASKLAVEGEGYQVMRLSRRRFFGHPTLVQYITRIGKKVAKNGLGTLLVGDLSQPRGGPMMSGHASHQTGLDVDVWFWEPTYAKTRRLTADEREKLSAKSLVKANTDTLDSALWSARVAQVLKVSASDAAVDRIFVNAAIKREMCRIAAKYPRPRPWLKKLRPWYGHSDHFHVRLKCPASQAQCTPTEAIPEGDGCDASLDWWFSDEAKEEYRKLLAQKKTSLPVLPEACDQVLSTQR